MGKSFEPKYLTPQIARVAVRHVVEGIFASANIGSLLKRQDCSVVVLVPQWISDDDEGPGVMRALNICEENFGDKEHWKYPFDEIARSKAFQLWNDRNDDRTDVQPHLLMSGDAPFWGAAKMDGILVACSGVQPWFDKMIARMVAAVCIGFAYEAYMRSPEKANDELCVLP